MAPAMCGVASGRAADNRITTIAGISSRANANARRSDIGLYPVASIDCDRATAAKGSNVIGASDQGPDRVGCLINPGRISTVEQSGPSFPAADYHHDASRTLRFDSSLQCVNRTAVRQARKSQELLVISGALVGSPWLGSPPTG